MDNEEMQKLKEKLSKKKLTRAKAIKLYCRYECCVGNTTSWRDCSLTGCFLHKYRMGREIKSER